MTDEAQKRELLKSLLAERARGAAIPSSGSSFRPSSSPSSVPLSKGQRALWYLQQLAPESCAYNVVFVLRFVSPLNQGALEAAMAGLVERHEGLRVQLGVEGRRPLQRTLNADRPMLEIVHVDEGEVMDEMVRAFSRRPFDLTEEAPVRLVLFRQGEDPPALVWLFHHIAIDFWSIGLLVRDLDVLYRAAAAENPVALPKPEAFYGDFVRWQENRLKGRSGDQLRSYWRNRLDGVEAVAELPFDRPRAAELTFRGGTRRCDLDVASSAALQRLAGQYRTTVFTALLAVVFTLLAKLTGRRELLVGTPVAGRGRASFQEVVGYFVNLLPLNAELPRGRTFVQLLESVSGRVVEALDHGDLPFADIVEELGIQRDPSRAPLCDVGFAVESSKMDRLGIVPLILGEEGARTEIGGLVCEGLAVPQQEGQFDLNFHFLETKDGLAGLAMFNADLLDSVTVDRWCRHLQVLLSAVLENPEAVLDELSPFSPSQDHQLTFEWQGGVGHSNGSTVVDLFRRQAIESPEALALQGDGQTTTYRELEKQSDLLANLLRGHGVGTEVVVGVCLESSPALALVELAVLKAHGAYLPLDPSYPEERLAFMIADSAASVVVTSKQVEIPVSVGRSTVLLLEEMLAEGEGGSLQGIAQGSASPPAESLAYVIYTSGSTGRPKGVAVPHGGLPNLLRWHQQTVGVGVGDRLSSLSGPSFDPSGLEIWSALTAGATVLFPPPECRISGRRFARWLEAEGVNVGSAPTPLAEAFLSEELGSGAKLRSLFLGGDRLGTRPVPGASYRVFNLYGPTETTVVASGGRVRPISETASSPSIGRPIDGVRVHLLDDALHPVPAGVVGEVWVAGVGVVRGYLGQPGWTAASFLPDPFSEDSGGRFYRTGDLARWSGDGRLLFVGRRDQQVKIRGVRIELAEIESTLGALPQVSSVVVLDREVAGGGRSLVAYIVPNGAELDMGALKAHLEATLPATMVPTFFVQVESFPLTANGKVDRRALPAPDLQREERGEPVGNEETVFENRIAGVWQRVLGLQSVPPETSFFDLGGHSLLLGELLVGLEDELDRSLKVIQLLRYPTVRSLARSLAPRPLEDISSASGVEASKAGRLPLANEPIAVIGMGGRFPGASTLEAFWALLEEGKEGLRRLSDEEQAKVEATATARRKGAFVPVTGDLSHVEQFDADFFGLNPRETEILDPQQRLFLECAWEALEGAGAVPDSQDRTGVFAGVARSSYLDRHLAPRTDLVEEIGEYQLSLANDKDFLPTRVSYLLGLKGPSVNVQTACSTSLTAIHLACQSLRQGECHQALAGGAAVRLPQAAGYHFQQGMILSPDGHCRSFDASAAGTVGANGVGVVLLKPLARALADGDPVRAVILGSAMNNDGSLKAGYTAPSVDGQAEVLAAAYQAAGVDPGSIGYVEAHGTGTELGDPIEVEALNEVFGGKAEPGSIPLGSVKSNLGHLDAAAGVAGFMKAVLVLERRTIPASLHFKKPNPKIDFASGPFAVVSESRAFEQEQEPRRVGVSSFGIGGTNVHVVLEEAPEPASDSGEEAAERSVAELLVLSAKSPDALEATRLRLAEALGGSKLHHLTRAAWTLQTGRKAFEERLAVVVGAGEDAAAVLGDTSRHLVGSARSEPTVTFLFPGQGVQHPGMVRGLSRRIPALARSLDRCSAILGPIQGDTLRELLEAAGEETADKLRQTAVAQPLLFSLELSLARLWSSLGVEPKGMLGHSVGELVAACLAGVFSEEDGLRLVAARGRLVQALPPGAMLGVSLPEEEVKALLPPALALAAVNGPRSCVLSGPSDAVEEMSRRLSERGIDHRALHTSHAFHSSMMEPALDEFRNVLGKVDLKPPRLPFVSNVTGTWIQPDEATDPEYWARHLRGTVRFADGLRTLGSSGSPLLLEVGPGKTLGTFARRTLPSVRVIASLPHAKKADRDEETFLEAVGRLWLNGSPIQWEGLSDEGHRSKVSLPTYPFQRRRYWVEPVDAATGPEPTTTSPTLRKPVQDWLYRPTWIAAEPLRFHRRLQESSRRQEDGLWLLFLDRVGLGEGLAESLRRKSHPFVMVEPEEGVDLDEVFAMLPQYPSRIVHLGAYGAAGEPPENILEDGFFHLVAVAQKLAREGAEIRIDAVSSGACRVLPEDRVVPSRAAILGPLRVLPQECVGVETRLVDLPAPGVEEPRAILDALETELEVPGSDLVAWRRGQRWWRRFEPVDLSGAEHSGRWGLVRGEQERGPVVLITGGLGGVGVEITRHLAATKAARLALLSRRGEDRHRALHDLRQTGAEVEVVVADVTDRESLSAAIEKVKDRFGSIDGVVHAAGVAGGTMLEVLEREGALSVLAPKVLGTQNLVELLPPRELDFFLLCSSLSAVLGGIGQASYSAANAVLDAFAESFSEEGVTSVGWDLWRDIGMAAPGQASEDLRREMDRRRELGMSASEATGLLDRLLACALPRVAISTEDLEIRRRTPVRLEHFEEKMPALASSHDRPDLATPYAAPRSPTEEALVEIWGALLGIRTIGVHDDFFELGGHSLLGTRVLSRVADRYGTEVSLSVLFQSPTVAGLAAELDRRGAESPEEESKQRTPFHQEVGSGDSVRDGAVDLDSLDDTALTALLESMEALETTKP